MRYTFNSNLVQSLPGILGETPFSISAYVTTCTHHSINRNFKRGDLRIDSFLEICNAFHLDYRYFFLADATSIGTDQIVVPDSDWTPIEYHTERIPRYDRDYYKIWCSQFAILLSKRGYKIENILTGGRTTNEPIQTIQPITDADKRHTSFIGKASYNSMLMKSIPGILGKPGATILSELGKSHNAYYATIERGDIRVRTLVDLCNAYRISIEHFFCFDDKPFVPIDLITPEDQWQPVVFHAERFKDFCVEDSKQGGGLMDLYAKLGYSPNRFKRTISENTPITMCNLVEACNKLGCSPFYFFDLDVNQSNVRTISEWHRRIQELESQLTRAKAEKLQAESRLRHANALLDLKSITNK